MMYRLVMHECASASLFERYRHDCSKCPWDAIDNKVWSVWPVPTDHAWQSTHTHRTNAASDTMLTRTLSLIPLLASSDITLDSSSPPQMQALFREKFPPEKVLAPREVVMDPVV